MRHWAKGVARDYLKAQSYRILAANYAVRGGEIELIVQEGDWLVFVKVRQRKHARYGSAAQPTPESSSACGVPP